MVWFDFASSPTGTVSWAMLGIQRRWSSSSFSIAFMSSSDFLMASPIARDSDCFAATSAFGSAFFRAAMSLEIALIFVRASSTPCWSFFFWSLRATTLSMSARRSFLLRAFFRTLSGFSQMNFTSSMAGDCRERPVLWQYTWGVEPFTLGYRPYLDGVRGVAILLVLVCHIPNLPLQGGFIGVDLFFVLSGFLITSLLLEEWRATGNVSLGAFYARRALRLVPALLLVLGAAVLLSELRESRTAANATWTSALMTLFYSANWFLAYGAYPRKELSATWSLSVEEQFYLLWPLLLLVMLRLRCSRRTMAGVVIAGM